MKDTYFPDFPNDASLWVYVADRPLSEDEKAGLLDGLRLFFTRWKAHGHRVHGDAAIVDDRFLLLAGHVPDGELSGCGIDASLNAVRELFAERSIGFVSGLHVLFRDDEGMIHDVSRPAFRALVRSGEVTPATTVFDLSLTTVGALREDALEKPAGQSWHARVFRIGEPVG